MVEPNVAQPEPTSPSLPPDQVIVLRGVTWADYQRMLEIRGERSVPRLTFLKGALELMTPSRPHESIKSMIGCLVEAWCLAMDVDITPYGSWTLESKESDRGVEPDECYVLGDETASALPDLAIEVIWTSGSIDKLEVYRKLGVREVWIWREGRIDVYALREHQYEHLERSELLPDLDLEQLLPFIDIKPMTRAVREYSALLHEPRST